MEARFENLDELSTKKFYLQYRFPPSSVGEVSECYKSHFSTIRLIIIVFVLDVVSDMIRLHASLV